jgi:NAD(P)-dependent dehydrogenase (short-subunit alcohol dehydrogenase family)
MIDSKEGELRVDYDFSGKVVVISGGSRGIGFAAATRFVAAGGSVAFAGRREETVAAATEKLQRIVAGTGAKGGVLGIATDLTTQQGVAALVDAALERFGGVDVLVNSVGDSSYSAFLDVTDEMVVSSWTIKVLTAVRLTRALVPSMEARGGGAIVNVSGGAGREPQPAGIPAALANAGIRVFSKGGAADLARRGIAVNSISPGLVSTDRHLDRARLAAQQRGVSIEEILREVDAATPTGRVTTPDEVAELILFLASRRVFNLTGAEIVLDGGAGHAV